MATAIDKPRIHVKTKNLQALFDYCIESKTEFTVIPKNSNDTWEIELNIKSIIKAIKWGMFLKANKIDLIENPLLETMSSSSVSKHQPSSVKSKASKKTVTLKTENPVDPLFESTEPKNDSMPETPEEESISLLSFKDNKNSQDDLF